MSKLKIQIPSICQSEVKYVFTCFFKHFIPTPFDFTYTKDNQTADFILSYKGKSLRIKNQFFKTDDIKRLLTPENIPQKVDKSIITLNKINYPVVSIYGESSVEIIDEILTLNVDIISSTFFMLSRWEESVDNAPLDGHNRFDYVSCLASKQNFYQRPVVNEYIELLRALLKQIGLGIDYKREYQPIISYDIDMIRKWTRPKILFESIFNNLKDNKPKFLITDVLSFFSTRLLKRKDPYDSFEYLISSLINRHIKAITYFKTHITDQKYDHNLYRFDSDYIQNVIQEMSANEISCGLHPSYNTFNNPKQMNEEISAFSYSGQPSLLLRQHYLRFRVPLTWKLMNNLGVKNDSSMLYSAEAGFRCGICYTFPVYDFEERSILDITETPLLFMETPFLKNPKNLLDKVQLITNQVKKYRGTNMVLWHNNNLYHKEHKIMYENLLDIIEA